MEAFEQQVGELQQQEPSQHLPAPEGPQRGDDPLPYGDDSHRLSGSGLVRSDPGVSDHEDEEQSNDRHRAE